MNWRNVQDTAIVTANQVRTFGRTLCNLIHINEPTWFIWFIMSPYIFSDHSYLPLERIVAVKHCNWIRNISKVEQRNHCTWWQSWKPKVNPKMSPWCNSATLCSIIYLIVYKHNQTMMKINKQTWIGSYSNKKKYHVSRVSISAACTAK